MVGPGCLAVDGSQCTFIKLTRDLADVKLGHRGEEHKGDGDHEMHEGRQSCLRNKASTIGTESFAHHSSNICEGSIKLNMQAVCRPAVSSPTNPSRHPDNAGIRRSTEPTWVGTARQSAKLPLLFRRMDARGLRPPYNNQLQKIYNAGEPW